MKKFQIIENNQDTSDDSNRLVVQASVTRRKFAADPVETIELGDVIVFLKEQGIDVQQNYVCQQQTTVGNNAENHPLSAQFVFLSTKTLTSTQKTDTVNAEVKESKVPPAPKSTTKSTSGSRRRRRSRASTAKKTDQLLGTQTLE
mgnify:CR=1 FL=1